MAKKPATKPGAKKPGKPAPKPPRSTIAGGDGTMPPMLPRMKPGY